MRFETCVKASFAVIGKLGDTSEGAGFIGRLWDAANADFAAIAPLVTRDKDGQPAGFWGAMSDMSGAFRPWEDDFTRGLYLAGAECPMDAEPPVGWVRWVVPGYEYRRVPCTGPDTFPMMIAAMRAEGVPLAGAVHDFTCPATGEQFMYFPIRRL